MLDIVTAVAPCALLIALGGVLKKIEFVSDEAWRGAERISYYILLPALIMSGLANADLTNVSAGPLALALILSTILVAAAMIAAAATWGRDGGPTFTSVFQGGVRFNNFIGITMAVGLFGAPGVALAAVANAAVIPTVNVLCVIVFALFGNARLTVGGLLRALLLNPLLVACAIGIAIQANGLKPPGFLGIFLSQLGLGALPLGLLCVGAALDFRMAAQRVGPVFLSSLVKFGVLPAVTAGICLWMGLDERATMIAVLFQALPTAASSYVMSRQLGGDAPLMAGIIASQTLCSLVVLPLVLVGHRLLI